MKRTRLVSAVLLLFLIIDGPPLIMAQKKAVVDVEGNELRSGLPYYVVSAIWGAGGGGLSPAIMKGTSTTYVMQHQSDLNRGNPVKFTPASSSNDRKITRPRTIYESTDLQVQFVGEDGVWMLHGANEFGTRYVAVDFIPLLSFPPVKNFRFQIEKVGQLPGLYKFVYCHGADGSSKTSCGDLGITVQDGKRWLALSESPFVFVFIHDRELLKQMT